jgi:hypothetical protein
MKQELKPNWPDDQRAAGERFRQAWDDFFSANPPGGSSEQLFPAGTGPSKISEIRARHESELLRYPHVVGVSEGIRTKQGKPTGEHCLVVLVERKIPAGELDRGELLPDEVEGIPVDVVEVGKLEPLQT